MINKRDDFWNKIKMVNYSSEIIIFSNGQMPLIYRPIHTVLVCRFMSHIQMLYFTHHYVKSITMDYKMFPIVGNFHNFKGKYSRYKNK